MPIKGTHEPTAGHPDCWWKSAVVYQIYPRSFHDSNGDGIGDLPGITAKLDYLKWLGVDAVWLSPFYRSPMEDFGYDISDFTDVDPIFGTLQDFDILLTKAHAAGIKVIVDFVRCHTSERHPWFVESRTSRDATKRDWYLWRDPAVDGGPPNNWRCVTGGSAWTLDLTTNQYYLHSFLPIQPDLNWRHPEVKVAMLAALRFWLDKGVDGIRVDMIDFMLKDAEFRDERHADYTYDVAERHINQPEFLDLLGDLRTVTEEYRERLIVGEIFPKTDLARLASYYGQDDRMHLPFNFRLLDVSATPQRLRAEIEAYLHAVENVGVPNFTLGNHDTVRLATRIGPENKALAAVLLLTLPGAIFIYYGDELGLEQVPIDRSRAVDPWEFREPGKGRDGARTPMPWSSGLGGGFTQGNPWLPISEGHYGHAVSVQRADPNSLLWLYRQLLHLRASEAALSSGSMEFLETPGDLLAYRRRSTHSETTVVFNFAYTRTACQVPTGEKLTLSCFSGKHAPGIERGEWLLGPKQAALFTCQRRGTPTVDAIAPRNL